MAKSLLHFSKDDADSDIFLGSVYTWMTGQALRGFEGMVIADRADQHDFMNDGHMICNGGGLWMDGRLSGGTYDRKTSSNSFRQASKNIVRVTQDVLGSVGPIALPLVETRCMSPRPTRA